MSKHRSLHDKCWLNDDRIEATHKIWYQISESVPCPTCKAEVGYCCISPTFHDPTSPHKARMDLSKIKVGV